MLLINAQHRSIMVGTLQFKQDWLKCTWVFLKYAAFFKQGKCEFLGVRHVAVPGSAACCPSCHWGCMSRLACWVMKWSRIIPHLWHIHWAFAYCCYACSFRCWQDCEWSLYDSPSICTGCYIGIHSLCSNEKEGMGMEVKFSIPSDGLCCHRWCFDCSFHSRDHPQSDAQFEI